jgi:GT2 family glycosyltransferase
VIRQVGGPRSSFRTLDGAALELGHRYIQSGVVPRHVPGLVRASARSASSASLPLEDELRFLRARFGESWARWALCRAALSGYAPPRALLEAWRGSALDERVADRPFRRSVHSLAGAGVGPRVSVLIPTLQRYPYLKTVLDQLRKQTVSPLEVIVVDQTPEREADHDIPGWYPDLPIRLLRQAVPGQCSSRNRGLSVARGDYVLLLDDDVELPPQFIETLLRTLLRHGAASASAVVHEPGEAGAPTHGTGERVSDVFPAGVTLVRRDVLEAVGGFDPRYEKSELADGELGMRLYLAGHLLMLDTGVPVLHHRAARGGLRFHKTRVVTYASSRRSIRERHLPSTYEIYHALRYYTPRQVNEAAWLRVLGTFSLHGSTARRALKAILSALVVPFTLASVRKRRAEAAKLLSSLPPDVSGLPQDVAPLTVSGLEKALDAGAPCDRHDCPPSGTS